MANKRRPRKASKMRRLRGLFWAAFGAVVTYLFDPRDGKRRRAVARDRAAGTFRDLRRKADKRARYLEGKAHGLVHELHGEEPKPWQNDATLKHKIESEILRHFDGKINVNVENGVAVLRGQLGHADEIRKLEEDVGRVPGINGVENLLHLPKAAGGTRR